MYESYINIYRNPEFKIPGPILGEELKALKGRGELLYLVTKSKSQVHCILWYCRMDTFIPPHILPGCGDLSR